MVAELKRNAGGDGHPQKRRWYSVAETFFHADLSRYLMAVPIIPEPVFWMQMMSTEIEP